MHERRIWYEVIFKILYISSWVGMIKADTVTAVKMVRLKVDVLEKNSTSSPFKDPIVDGNRNLE